MEPQFEKRPLDAINPTPAEEEILWCQELAVTLDPFDANKLTPRQIFILNQLGWLAEVGQRGFELTQKILQKLHQHSQSHPTLHK